MSAIALTKARAVFEFEGSRNLFTTPLTISNLRGDLYDYEIVSFFDVEGVNSNLLMTFNNDSTANYREYRMEGNGSSATATVVDTRTYVSISNQSFSFPTLTRARTESSAGDERVVNSLHSRSLTSGDIRVTKQSAYWQNAADEITSITLTKSVSVTSTMHIVLFATPKDSAQEEWELIDTKTFVASATTQTFTGLNGDVDGQYKVRWDGDQVLGTTINGDTDPSYIRQMLRNVNGAISSTNLTASSIDGRHNDELVINAVSGKKRLCTLSTSATSSTQQMERGFWYTETGANVTTLEVTPQAAATGVCHLFRKRTLEHTSDTLPWETVEEVIVNTADFSSGHTFSNLTGDSEFLYRLEWISSANSSTIMTFHLNGDSSLVYTNQYLRANSSNVNAISATGQAGIDLIDSQNNAIAVSDVIIYPKSGQQRPVLIKQASRESRVKFEAAWWGNTSDEITSIVVSGSVGSVEGTLRLSKIPRIQP